MKQFLTILKFELKYYFKNKNFVGVTIFLVVAIALVMFFPLAMDIIKSGDTTDTSKDLPVMLVKGTDDTQADFLKQSFSEAFTDYEIQVTTDSEGAIKDKILSEEAECAFVMTSPISYTYFVNNLSLYDQNTLIANEVLQNVYRMNALVGSGLSPEDATGIMTMQIESTIESLGKDQTENYFYTYIMIMSLYMVMLLYGQMVATNVATEKSSRAMEVLITSTKPTSMMFGKVIASCIAGFTQLVIIFGSSIFFYNLNKSYWEDNQIVSSIFDMPVSLLVYMLVFFILGFFVYAFLYGAIGSTASKVEDINTSVMPLTFLYIIAFMIVIVNMNTGAVDNTIMKVCSYIPFTSPMAMFTRIAMSTVPWYEIAISIGVLIASVIGIGVLSAKIYRVGVLLYGTPPKISAILKAIRKA